MSGKAKELVLDSELGPMGLRFDFNAIAEVEEVTGINLLALDGSEEMTAARLRAIVSALNGAWAEVREDEERLTLAQVGSRMNAQTLGDIMAFMSPASSAKGGGDADPTEVVPEQETQPA